MEEMHKGRMKDCMRRRREEERKKGRGWEEAKIVVMEMNDLR